MIVYFLFMLVLIVIALFSNIRVATNIDNFQQPFQNFGTYIMGLAIILLVGLRKLSGTDTRNYKAIFDTNIYPIDIEPYYHALSAWFSSQGVSFYAFEMVISVITFVPIIVVYKKWSDSSAWSLVMLYGLNIVFNAFNIARQMIAVSIFLYAVYIASKGISVNSKSWKLLWFSLTLVFFYIAANFHTSTMIAVAVLLASLLLGFFRSKLPMLDKVIVPFTVILSITAYSNIGVVTSVLNTVVTKFFGNYGYYLVNTSAVDNVSELTLFLTLVRIALFVHPAFRYKKGQNVNNFLVNIYIIGTIVAGLQIGWVTDRISQFLTIFLPIMLVNLYCERRSNHRGRMTYWDGYYVSLVLLYILVTFLRTLLQNFGGMIPYMKG